MNKSLNTPFLVLLIGLATWPAHAQDAATDSALQLPEKKSPDRYGLSFRMGFNITTSFKNAGSVPPPGHLVPQPGAGMTLQSQPGNPDGDQFGNRTYEDGYVWVDNTGNAMDFTHYWGYDNKALQFNPSAGTIDMHSSSSPGVNSNNRSDDPQLGLEFTYNRELGGGKGWRWGIEAAFNYTDVTVHDSHPLTGSGSLTANTFQVPPTFEPGTGIVPGDPPSAPPPYYGTYYPNPNGNPVIVATPIGTNYTSFSTQINGSRHFDADVFGWRIGPYAEFPLSSKVSVFVSGGLSLVVVSSDFSYNETVIYDEGTGNGPVTRSSSGSGSHSDLLVGGYIGSTVNVALSKNWGAFAGVQFQSAGEYTQTVNDKKAVLDLGQSVFVSIGVSCSF
jgi:hypothetical protein